MRYLILDLETLPISNAADFIATDDIAAPEHYVKPEAIEKYIAKEKANRLAKAALDLDLARICVFGYASDRKEPHVFTARTEELEAQQMGFLAEDIDQAAGRDILRIITFNGHAYDLPLLMRRAKYLGVPFPRINLDRYKSHHVDLYEELRLKRNDIKAHSLRWYMRRLGMTDLLESDPLKDGGADVGQAAKEERWDDIAAHALVDIKGTLRLAAWMGVVPASVPETAGAF